MANVISDETIEYVGILAKLELSDEEKEAAKKDMGRMLDHTIHAGSHSCMRGCSELECLIESSELRLQCLFIVACNGKSFFHDLDIVVWNLCPMYSRYRMSSVRTW